MTTREVIVRRSEGEPCDTCQRGSNWLVTTAEDTGDPPRYACHGDLAGWVEAVIARLGDES
jgi:hypothetical protein